MISRSVDPAANVTKFSLLPPAGALNVVMSLNNRSVKKQAVSVAKSVIVDRVSQTHEQFDATITLRVLHGSVQQAEVLLPDGYEVLATESPLVSGWSVIEEAPRRVRVAFRSPVSESATIRLSAVRSGKLNPNWTFPKVTVRTWSARRPCLACSPIDA